MSLLRSLGSGLRFLFRKEQVNRELDEELGEYPEMATDEKMKQGMSRQEALRAVQLEGGSLDGTKRNRRCRVSWTRQLWSYFGMKDNIPMTAPATTSSAGLILY